MTDREYIEQQIDKAVERGETHVGFPVAMHGEELDAAFVAADARGLSLSEVFEAPESAGFGEWAGVLRLYSVSSS